MVKNLPANAGDTGDPDLILGLGRSLEVGYGNPLQYSCLEDSMDRGARLATVHEVAKRWDTTEHAHTDGKLLSAPDSNFSVLFDLTVPQAHRVALGNSSCIPES